MLIYTTPKIKYLGFCENKTAQTTVKKLLFIGAVLLISIFLSKRLAFSATSNSPENNSNDKLDISIFSSALSVSQQDYKEENINALAEDNIKKDVEKGIISTTSPNVALCINNNNIEGQDFVSSDSKPAEEKRRNATEYVVKEGETVSNIAAKFGLKTQTLLWANNLDVLTIVHPGDRLTIPPEDGVMYKVKKGDTLGAISQKYSSNTSEIMDFNQLDSADSIVEGQTLFLPNGKVLASVPQSLPSRTLPSPKTSSPSVSNSKLSSNLSKVVTTPVIRRGSSGGGHSFPYGYCTWYVAQKRGGVPWGGNAREWLGNARAAGYATGSKPVPGAIMVTRESWWGHVAYVESVSGDSVTISEMNKAGYGIVSRRTISNNSGIIRGYIY